MWKSLVIIAALLPYRLALAESSQHRVGPAHPGDPEYWVKLSGITPSDGELTPRFDANTADYTLISTNPDDKMYTIRRLQPTPLSAERLHLNLRILPRFGYCRMENSLRDPRWVCRTSSADPEFSSSFTDAHATVFLVNPDGSRRYKLDLGIPKVVKLPPPEVGETAWNLKVEGGPDVLSFPVEVKIAALCSTLKCPVNTKPRTFSADSAENVQAHLCDSSPCTAAADALVCCVAAHDEWDHSWTLLEDVANQGNKIQPLDVTDLGRIADRLRIDVTKPDIGEMIAAVDGRTDTDGGVDRGELDALIGRISADKELVELWQSQVKSYGGEAAFKKWNPNGDKGVTIAELEAAMKRPELAQAHRFTVPAMISSGDLDKDGYVSREELNLLVKRWAGEHSLYELSLAARWQVDKEEAGVQDHPIRIVVPAKVAPAKPQALGTIEMIVRDLDITGDDKVRAGGLLPWAKRNKKEGADISEAELKHMVDELDKNKNGGLEPAEFAPVLMTTEGHETKLFKWLAAGIHDIQPTDAFTSLLQDLVARPVVHTDWLDGMRNSILQKAHHFYNYGCDPAIRQECTGKKLYYEPSCSVWPSRDGGSGCFADGINPNCKFCGFKEYMPCPQGLKAQTCFTAPCKKWTREHTDWCSSSFGVICPEQEPKEEEWKKLFETYSGNYNSCHSGMGVAQQKWDDAVVKSEDKAEPEEADAPPWRRLVSSAVVGFGVLATAVFAVVSLQRRRSQVGGGRYVFPVELTEDLGQE